MINLTLRTTAEDHISLSKIFIKEYMPKASGEFIKIYLHLLCCLSDKANISISDIADTFDLTEKDVLRALNYWRKERLIVTEDDGVNLTSITFLPIASSNITLWPATIQDVALMTEVVDEKPQTVEEMEEITTADTEEDILETPEKHPYTLDEVDGYKSDEGFKTLLFSIETYFKKTLSSRDVETLIYIISELKFTYDMVEYLVEQCIDSNIRSIAYIEKVAISYHKKGCTSLNQIKEYCTQFRTTYSFVMKHLGIPKDHTLTETERGYIDKWTLDQIPMELIKKACIITISKNKYTNKFNYADKILYTWKNNNLTTEAQVDAYIESNKRNDTLKAATKKAPAKLNTTFNNIAKKDHDFELIEVNNTRKHAGLAPLTREELDAIRARKAAKV